MIAERFVYSLRNEEGTIFYIGSTHNPMKRRDSHFNDKKHVGNFIRQQMNDGHQISMVIEFAGDERDAFAKEKEMIQEHQGPLLNRQHVESDHPIKIVSEFPLPKKSDRKKTVEEIGREKIKQRIPDYFDE